MKLSEDQLKVMLARAMAIRENAYAPYSKYSVGASVLAGSGAIYFGANVENAAYPSSMCAERAAIFNAVSNGEREIEAILIVSRNGGSPCGACRQVLAEFDHETEVIIANSRGEVGLRTTLEELLPHSFGPDDLTAE
jgi:cytidine deaminase